MTRRSWLHSAWIVYAKEVLDALRDRRTLMVVLVSSVLMGPLVLIALSGLLAQFEERAEQRSVVTRGMEHAPTLRNYFERQAYTITEAPTDFGDPLRRSALADPVLVIPADFEAALKQGDVPVVELVSDSANAKSQAGAARIARLLAGFSQERATLSLALRGVSPELLRPIEVEERDLASTQTRGAQLTAMLPFFVMMAMLYGALNAALDSTAGERERGSLEPLLMNPTERLALVLGKWGAVVSLGMLVAVLSSLSFIPAQWLLQSDTLQALFQFGLREALMFLAVLLPLAAALSAVLMAVAIRCKSFKEAQANSTVVMLGASLMPLVTVFNPGADAPWHLWVPALAQNTLMTRVLKGEAFTSAQMLVPLGVCVVLTAIGLWAVTRSLHSAAVK